MVQTAIPDGQVDAYLQGHRHEVSGLVYRLADLPDPGTPAELFAATGAATGGFRASDRSVHVIRWPAYCPALYRPVPGSASAIAQAAHAVVLPHGAQIHRLDSNASVTWVASFDADVQQWIAAPDPSLFRQALMS